MQGSELHGGDSVSYAVKVKREQMSELRRLTRKNETEMAKTIGVSRGTYRRAMEGENVSAAFIAGASLGFRVPFDSLFYTVEMKTKQAA
jgi:HTH-type transcriptional regulator/antitoxin PezA